MLGGGTFTSQNKTLPGSYINFVSAAKASAVLGERGKVAIALPLTWGADDAIFELTADTFVKDSLKLLGFAYDSEEAKGLRDVFKNASVVYCYKLMNGGAKASNAIAEAKYKGSFGTKISTQIVAGTNSGSFEVSIFVDNTIVWSASVASVEQLKSFDNGYVNWTLADLAASDKTALTGADLDGAAITAAQHSAFLDASESYLFNVIACLSSETAIVDLYVQEVKDMRENHGIKYQLVVFNDSADYEGVINVKNSLDALYWVAGAEAACPINSTLTNALYTGEMDIPVNYSQAELENAITSGQFVLHRVGEEIRVLEDINSLVTVTEQKGEDFKNNQSIRVIDQIAMDIAALFNVKYLGKIPNDASGRISLWNDIVKHHQELVALRAIENFNPSDVVVDAGDTKKSVVVSDAVTIVNAISQLYMTVVVQ